MPDEAFVNPRLAALYDAAEVHREDLVHYLTILQDRGAESVLDVGCGTGTFACMLAAEGIDVVGVDPAAASLDIARRKPFADKVRWIHGTASDLTDVEVDVAVMTGNVAQVFVADDDWNDVLLSVARSLKPGGTLIFETRDPAKRGWEEWTREQSLRQIGDATSGPVTSWVDVTEVALPFVTFQWSFQFTDEMLTSQSTLRFRSREEVEGQLRAAGYRVIEVREAPDRPGKEFVFISETVV